MGECCNAKCLSYASAWLQLVASVIVIICMILAVAISAPEELEEEFGSAGLGTTVLVIIIAVVLINLGLLVTLILGLKQDRIAFVKIYLYPNIVLSILYVLNILASFVMGFVNQQSAGTVFVDFFSDLLSFGLNLLWLAPIYVHFKNMAKPRQRPVQCSYAPNY